MGTGARGATIGSGDRSGLRQSRSTPPSGVLADPEMGPPAQGADPSAQSEPQTKAKKNRRDKENFARPWRSQSRGGRSRAVGIGAAGVLGGFLAHELGHVLMNLALRQRADFRDAYLCRLHSVLSDLAGDPLHGRRLYRL